MEESCFSEEINKVNNHAARVLVIQDMTGCARQVCEDIVRAGSDHLCFEFAASLSEGLVRLSGKAPDAVLLDLLLPDSRGLDTFYSIKESTQDVPVIILTDPDNKETAVSALHHGALDYLVNGCSDPALLLRSLHYAVERGKTCRALKESEKWYRDIFDRTMTPILIIGPNDNYIDCNAAAVRFFECARHELLTKNIYDFMVGDYKEAMTGKFTFEDGERTFEAGYHINGRLKLLELNISRLRVDGRKVYLCIGQNITDREEAQEKIRKSEERYRRIAEAVTDYIYKVSMRDGRPVETFHSEACFSVTGYTIKEFDDDPYLWINMVYAEDRDHVRRQIEDLMAGQYPDPVEHRIIRKDGTERWVVNTVVPNYDLDGKLISYDGIVRDITENKKTQKQLEHQAFYDQLTNLPNRAMFSRNLEAETELAKRNAYHMFAVLFLDLDRFKVVNDSLGHAAGDHLLVTVSRRLNACIRASDMLARFGGDEFAILLREIKDIKDATDIADRIQEELRAPVLLNGLEIFVSASIGIALSATGYEWGDDILRDADSAMYRAKEHGRARYELFDTQMYFSVLSRLQMEADLRRAIKQREFTVHYQPVMSLPGCEVVGAEALVRWNHPQRGIIQPMEFIPLAEETGLIAEIGEWVLWAACAWNRKLQDAGHGEFLMKVNFSTAQFHLQDIADLVRRVTLETGLDARYLDIEITESIATEEGSVRLLNKLSGMGVRISIDDFGTGYSSLAALKRLPINTIKIDRSFIGDISSDTNAKSIIRAIIAMAHNLNMKVLAEGVETGEQLEYLIEHGCDEAQGFFFSRAVAEEEFSGFLSKKTDKDPGKERI